jgi:hypothetical protein
MVPERGKYTTEEAWLLVGLWDMCVRMRGQKEWGYPRLTLPTDPPISIQLGGGYLGDDGTEELAVGVGGYE